MVFSSQKSNLDSARFRLDKVSVLLAGRLHELESESPRSRVLVKVDIFTV